MDQIGDGCDILCNLSSFGSEPYLIRLGMNVTITQGAFLLTHDGATRTFRTHELRWRKEMGVYGRIEVGDNVFIGVNSIVIHGVCIGSKVVIGAGSVVTTNVLSNVVIAGNPARLICSFDDYLERALSKAIAVKSLEEPTRRRDLMAIFWGTVDSNSNK